MKKLIVQLVTWNGEKYISHLFSSLKNQTYTEWELHILDNASTDGTVTQIQEAVRDWHIPCHITVHTENSGFAGGHNALFAQHDSAYVMLLNQDMYLEPECIARMVQFLDTHPDGAVVSPRLMRWDVSKGAAGGTDVIDSLGLKVFRNRRVIEKYQGKHWHDVKAKMHLSFRAERFRDEGMALEVFGVSGTLPLFRRAALRDAAFVDGTFFDASYHAYKEDVDLAFRLRGAGYRSFVLLETVAYHDRSAQGDASLSDRVAAKNKAQQSAWVVYHSYKNHLMTLYKNEYWQNWLLDAAWIKWYELKKCVWFLLFKPSVLRGLGEIWKQRKTLKQKRAHIQAQHRMPWKAIRVWWR